MIDPVKNFNTLTSSTRLVLTFKPVESLYILDKSKMDKTPNVKRIDLFHYLFEFYVSCFTKAPERHHETLIENTIALLNVFLKRDRNNHAIYAIVYSSTNPNIARLDANVGAPALTRRWK